MTEELHNIIINSLNVIRRASKTRQSTLGSDYPIRVYESKKVCYVKPRSQTPNIPLTREICLVHAISCCEVYQVSGYAIQGPPGLSW